MPKRATGTYHWRGYKSSRAGTGFDYSASSFCACRACGQSCCSSCGCHTNFGARRKSFHDLRGSPQATGRPGEPHTIGGTVEGRAGVADCCTKSVCGVGKASLQCALCCGQIGRYVSSGSCGFGVDATDVEHATNNSTTCFKQPTCAQEESADSTRGICRIRPAGFSALLYLAIDVVREASAEDYRITGTGNSVSKPKCYGICSTANKVIYSLQY